jgi:hypothetical protein
MHTCCNLISQSILYMFRALKAHHQKLVVKIQALWYNTCPHIWYMVSHQGVVKQQEKQFCGWESELDLNWTQVQVMKENRNNVRNN